MSKHFPGQKSPTPIVHDNGDDSDCCCQTSNEAGVRPVGGNCVSVSTRWLIKHWNRGDIPRPPQQPGDPQVKTKQRRGVDRLFPLLQGDRLKPPPPSLTPNHFSSVVDSPCQPCPGQTILLCSPHPWGSNFLWPSFFPSSRKNIWSPPPPPPPSCPSRGSYQHFHPPWLRSKGWWSSPPALWLKRPLCILNEWWNQPAGKRQVL